jgi:CDP-diacylglycerol--glycerol-3-phosphate 3-phosphatidyltransferase
MLKLNLPTKITLVRFAMLPLIMFFYIAAVCIWDVPFFIEWGRLVAAVLFVIAVATDWLDGYIARKYNMVTNTGKLLDPVADKMVTMLGFILILSDPVWDFVNPIFAFQYWFAVITVFIALGRDIVMNSLRFIAAEQGITIAADRLGKTKSLCQFIAITLYMLFAFNLNPNVQFVPDGLWLDLWGYVCLFIMTAAAVLSVWSCVNYISDYAAKVQQKGSVKDGQK